MGQAKIPKVQTKQKVPLISLPLYVWGNEIARKDWRISQQINGNEDAIARRTYAEKAYMLPLAPELAQLVSLCRHTHIVQQRTYSFKKSSLKGGENPVKILKPR